jgi:hypothetical protein
MTKIQQKFYDMITNQIVDFSPIFHKEFIQERIQKIPEHQLRFLQENIITNKDKIGKKNYIDYSKFTYYADKMINEQTQQLCYGLDTGSKAQELYKKREMLIQLILDNTNSIDERNKFIENIKTKQTIFQQDGKNILDAIDYYIIEQFGFYNFFDPNKNYMVYEEIEKHLYSYYMYSSNFSSKKLLN